MTAARQKLPFRYPCPMRRAVFLAVFLVAGCGPTRTLDCALVEQQFGACMDEYVEQGERAVFLECIPHSKAERISGTWVLSWEFSPFYEGQALSFEEATRFPETMTQLVRQGTELGDDYEFEQTKLYELEFIGRRPQCDLMGPGQKAIVVDEVITKRLIEQRPSIG